ncbi:O-antigen ligase family protein [Actinomycetospora aeridis]|uniref:O-antigen ligase family protein n=1 Tax=Actinomycetospora aeridis TaxID=3129231 RepID=A0ABU8N802_9PSEU
MSLLPGGLRDRSRTEVVVGVGAVVVVLGIAVAAPSQAGMLLAAIGVGAVVFAIALNNPVIALILVVLASFGRTAQKEFVSVEALTPLFYAMVIALALAVGKRAKEMPRLGTIEWLMTTYLVWQIISALLPHAEDAADPVTGASSEVYRWIFSGTILPFVAYVVAKSVLNTEQAVRWFLWTVVGMSTYSAWVSVIQFHGPKRLVWPRYIVDAPNWEGRAVGLFNQPVVNGMLLAIGFVVCLYLATRPGTDRRVKWLLYAITLPTAYAIYLTHTRSALLSLVVALLVGAVLAKGWRKPFVVYLVAGAAGVAANAPRLFSSDRSSGGIGSSNEIYDRLNIMATSFKAIAEHPVFGIGIGRFRAYNTYEHIAWSQEIDWNRGRGIISHQNELGIAAELGLPGVILWISILVGIFYLLYRALRELPDGTFLGQPLAVVGTTIMIILVANGMTVDLRILDFAGLLPFVFAGMVVGQLERFRDTRPAPRAGTPGAGLPGGMSPADQVEWQEGQEAKREAVPVGAPLVTRRPMGLAP